ncbi:MAG: cytochrome P450, partial [Paracoccaceae bacterium]
LDPEFVQNPYPFYERVRASGKVFHWQDFDVACTVNYACVWSLLRDRRMGREPPPGHEPEKPPHQAAFWAIEDHSLLELEPPRHTRLRGLILRAFTSRRIAALAPEITTLTHQLIDQLNGAEIDLLASFAQHLPIIIIARLLGVPEERASDLLGWSHAMVAMYQADRNHQTELAANRAAHDFAAFMREHIQYRRNRPGDDLITHLISAHQDGEHLSTDELITTCILLLNAGHEATVHAFGNGIRALLLANSPHGVLASDKIDATVEEIIRFDPPLHMFQRWAYEPVKIGATTIEAGEKIALLLAGANRDPARWRNPARFDPSRPIRSNTSFGAGTHFCIGAPLARLELRTALPILFARLPKLRLAQTPQYAPTYHFHGLRHLMVSR